MSQESSNNTQNHKAQKQRVESELDYQFGSRLDFRFFELNAKLDQLLNSVTRIEDRLSSLEVTLHQEDLDYLPLEADGGVQGQQLTIGNFEDFE